jgi:hypothetical protein
MGSLRKPGVKRNRRRCDVRLPGADGDPDETVESQRGKGDIPSGDWACTADHGAKSDKQRAAIPAVRARMGRREYWLMACPWEEVPTSAPVYRLSGADSEWEAYRLRGDKTRGIFCADSPRLARGV